MHITRYLLAFLLFGSLLYNNTYGQKAVNPPLFKEASVIQGAGNVRLVWELDAAAIAASADVFIYRDSPNEWYIVDSVKNTTINEYTDITANANINPRLYKLRARTIDYSSDSKKFPTNLLDFTYDSCKAEVNLSWTNTVLVPYSSSDVNFVRYEIYVSNDDGFNYEKIGETTNKNYTLTNIQESTNYKFYISGVPEHLSSSKSSSNTVSLIAQMPLSPDFIYARSASVNGSTIDLEFEIDPVSELTTFKLLRSENVNGPFDTIQTIHSSEHTIFINDTEVKTSKKVYYYKLASVNNCNIVTKESDIINSVLLNVSNSDFDNTLEWNAFKESTSADCYYKIYRIVENQESSIKTLMNEYSYIDNVDELIGTNAGGKICYYVVSWVNSGVLKLNNSNIDCIIIEPKVLVPNAITPNAINKNCCFKPAFSFLPTDYFLVIYNRWANVVFETTDPEASWDGRYPNGQYVPAGAYIFYLKINTENNQSIEKRGNITVIYP
ncbi:MAG: hypothetical protein A2041_14465 [Bacteroidetes bacterium GWA2_31_9b]|nr:MAG: hypothetical protein A2041_14465 [Bacteroidetes bacterium GWA2_31_9b]